MADPSGVNNEPSDTPRVSGMTDTSVETAAVSSVLSSANDHIVRNAFPAAVDEPVPSTGEKAAHRDAKELITTYLNTGRTVTATGQCSQCRRSVTSSVSLACIDGTNPVAFSVEKRVKHWSPSDRHFATGQFDVAGLDTNGHVVLGVEVKATHRTQNHYPRDIVPWIEATAFQIRTRIPADKDAWNQVAYLRDIRNRIVCNECRAAATGRPQDPDPLQAPPIPQRDATAVDKAVAIFCDPNRERLFSDMWDSVARGATDDRVMQDLFGISRTRMLARAAETGMDAQHLKGSLCDLVRSDGYLALLDAKATRAVLPPDPTVFHVRAECEAAKERARALEAEMAETQRKRLSCSMSSDGETEGVHRKRHKPNESGPENEARGLPADVKQRVVDYLKKHNFEAGTRIDYDRLEEAAGVSRADRKKLMKFVDHFRNGK
jgi:hypothetical protein